MAGTGCCLVPRKDQAVTARKSTGIAHFKRSAPRDLEGGRVGDGDVFGSSAMGPSGKGPSVANLRPPIAMRSLISDGSGPSFFAPQIRANGAARRGGRLPRGDPARAGEREPADVAR